MTLVEEDPVDDALDGLIKRGVVEDDIRGLAPELQGQLLPGPRDAALDLLADLGGTGERDLVDAGVRDQRGADVAGPRQDVHHARWKSGLLADFGEHQGGQWCRLGGLEHHGVTAGQRRGDLPGQHEQREVPRDDLRGDPERPRIGAIAGVAELVGPAGVVEEVRGGGRDVGVP